MPKEISYSLLNSVFDYDPETGILSWKSRPISSFSSGKYGRLRTCKSWNSRYAGKIAGCDNGDGYLVTRLNGVNYRVHRVAMCIILKRDFDGIVDHINGNRSDNRACNLRVATESLNARNTKRYRSGGAGVVWYKPLSKWRAQIWSNGRNVCLGYFSSKRDAITARVHGEKFYWGTK